MSYYLFKNVFHECNFNSHISFWLVINKKTCIPWRMSVWYENTTYINKAKSQHGKKTETRMSCFLKFDFQVWSLTSSKSCKYRLKRKFCGPPQLLGSLLDAAHTLSKKDHFKQLLVQTALHFLILHYSGQGSKKMQCTDFFNVKWLIWPWFFASKFRFFLLQKLLVLVCGRVGVSGIKSICFLFLDDVPYTEMESMESICVQCMKDNRRKPNLD